MTLAACASTSGGATDDAASRGAGADGTGADVGGPGGAPPPVLELLADTAPRGGTPLFAGFSPRLYEREEEEELAVEDAARDAVRYLEVRASAVLIAEEAARSAGVAEAVETRIPAERVDDVKSDLEVLKSIRHERGTVVIVSAPELPPLEVPAGVSVRAAVSWNGGAPVWVEEVPRVPGYDVAVGVAERRRRPADSVEAADERALAQIILARSARVRSVGESRRVEDVGTTERTTRAEEAADIVHGFYVVSRYVEPEGRYFYSLAVAPRESSGPAETKGGRR